MILTEDQFRQIMRKLPADKRAQYLPLLNAALAEFEINTPKRAAAFLAQIAHESYELKYFEEVWGPTDQQKRYEPPTTLAEGLGNTQEGDGYRYRGRGPMQLTGRKNYAYTGEVLGIDLVGNPDLAATPQVAFRTAALFWKVNDLNKLAEMDGNHPFEQITKRINGGLTGLQSRIKYWKAAQSALGLR
jgi:predicted chitinase